ncbi:hypothetical protein [Dinghuibacter silviterrae]|uniref:Secretin/TonB short N-terminal domain-containing protein n=1 Tax=Dinghuibacter silviterrae TaxID=1539049 RepID=A0A4R8DSU2_9BACT|nr:hypothetical protein [Dinghuibacter silviterrae]TDX00467.1 hypothetical protein EDB95_1492 [Dinghuibacter silviterrae]
MRFLYLYFVIFSISTLQKEVDKRTFSFSFFNAPLKQVIGAVEKKTGYHFNYVSKYIEDGHPVSFKVSSASLVQVLDLCFKGQRLTYRVVPAEKAIEVIPAAALLKRK